VLASTPAVGHYPQVDQRVVVYLLLVELCVCASHADTA
jgi:hypothetical protein